MKRILFLSIMITAVRIFCGCQKPGCVESAGPLTKEERILPSFSKIELDDNIDLVLIQGDSEKVEITAPRNILPNIQTNITNDVLSITNQTECRWLRNPDEKIKIKLYFKNISNFEYKGSGNVTNEDTLRLGSFWINSETGAGIIELKVNIPDLGVIILKENATMILHGYSEHCSTYTNARGVLNLSDLQAKRMYIIYSGLADTYIQVSDELDATIRYKGNVYCKGNPNIIRQDYFSSGRLIMLP